MDSQKKAENQSQLNNIDTNSFRESTLVIVKFFSELGKRAFDILAATFALIILSPFFILVMLAIKRDTPGPYFYRGPRIGKGGKLFHIIKFRTMYETPESYAGPRVTAQDDPRITPLGQWLRDTKLNELPQFWNVLKGEMSLVGPRPEDPSLAKTWPANVREEILSLRPGITSPASVQYHNEENLLFTNTLMGTYMQELGPDKLRLDQLYVRYRSFSLDLDVILWTVLIFLPRLRSYEIPENLLFVGPFSRLMHRYVNWFTIDFLVTFFCVLVTSFFWNISDPLIIGWQTVMLLSLCYALLFSLIGVVLGVNRIRWSQSTYLDALDLLPAWAIATVIATFTSWFSGLLPETLTIIAAVLALGGFIALRYRSRLITGLLSRIMVYSKRTRNGRERVLILGTGPSAQHVAWLFDHPVNSKKFWVVGFATNDLREIGMRVYGAKVLGTIAEVADLIKTYDIGILLLTEQNVTTEKYQQMLKSCEETQSKFVYMPDVVSSFNGLTNLPISGALIPVTGNNDEELRCLHCLAKLNSLQIAIDLQNLDAAIAAGNSNDIQYFLQSLLEKTNAVGNHT